MTGEGPAKDQHAQELTAGALADALGGVVATGDPSIRISGIAGLRAAGPGDVSFVADKRYARPAAETAAAALLVPEQMDIPPKCKVEVLIRVANMQDALDRVTELFAPPEPPRVDGVHPSAVVGREVALGQNVSVGPRAVIEDEARVGDNTTIGAQTFIGYRSVVGSDVRLFPGVTICHGCEVGDRAILHPGVVVGGDGFGFTFKGLGHEKIRHIGKVVIEDDVEVGSNTTIDRARFGATRVGRGTKIDNLVMIAHNVQVGEHCIITGQVGIAGSAVIGDYVMLGARAGLVGHIKIGDKAKVAAGSGVTKDLPAGATVMGIPAEPHERAGRIFAATRKLPDLIQNVKSLGKRIDALEQR